MDNGIRILSENIDTVHSVSLGFWILAGSIDEKEQTNGIAHVLEHMAFKQTSTRSAFDIANDIESLGGIINAYTSKNVTCYYVRLMYENLEDGVEVLTDIVKNWKIDPIEFEKEKTVVFEEIKDVEDTPSDIIFDDYHLQLFPDHSLGRPIQGTSNTVRDLNLEQLHDFIDHFYTGNRLVIAAAGQVDHHKLVQLVKKYTNGMKPGNNISNPSSIPSIKEWNAVKQRKIQQAHLIFGRRIFPKNDKRIYALSLLNVVLGDGMSSRLFTNIREKYGFIYSIFCFTEYYLNEGDFGFYIATDPTKIEQTKRLVFKELEKLAITEISSDELKKAKQQFKGSAMLHLENMQSRMDRLAKMEIFEKKLMTIDELLNIISNITAKELREVAEYLFDEKIYVETRIEPE